MKIPINLVLDELIERYESSDFEIKHFELGETEHAELTKLQQSGWRYRGFAFVLTKEKSEISLILKQKHE